MVSAACQGIFVPLILRFPASRLVSLAGIAGNLFIVVLYVVSYTWGMPFGPAWVPFDPAVAHLVNPEVLGTAATAAEMGIVILLTLSLEGSLRRAVINALLVVGALLWAEDRGYPPLIGVPRKMTDRSGGGQPHRSLPGKKGHTGCSTSFSCSSSPLLSCSGRCGRSSRNRFTCPPGACSQP